MCICFVFIKIYVICITLLSGRLHTKLKWLFQNSRMREKFFIFTFYSFCFVRCLNFFFFQACQETVRAPFGHVGHSSLTFVFRKPIPSSTTLPWIRNPRPPPSHWPILLSFGRWINTSGDSPTALPSTSAHSTKELSQLPGPITFAFSKDNAGWWQ